MNDYCIMLYTNLQASFRRVKGDRLLGIATSPRAAIACVSDVVAERHVHEPAVLTASVREAELNLRLMRAEAML
jgi:hypothetical protein